MSVETIASGGRPSWMARSTWRGANRSGAASRARAFQVLPGSSSSWSQPASFWSHADFAVAARFLRASAPLPGVCPSSASRSWRATAPASPQIPMSIGFASPSMSGLESTWMIFASPVQYSMPCCGRVLKGLSRVPRARMTSASLTSTIADSQPW